MAPVYTPLDQQPSRLVSFAVRTAGNPAAYIAPLRERLAELALAVQTISMTNARQIADAIVFTRRPTVSRNHAPYTFPGRSIVKNTR